MASGGANESWGSGGSDPIKINHQFPLSWLLETKMCEIFEFSEGRKITLFQLWGDLAPTKKIFFLQNFFYLIRTCMNFGLKGYLIPDPRGLQTPYHRTVASKTFKCTQIHSENVKWFVFGTNKWSCELFTQENNLKSLIWKLNLVKWCDFDQNTWFFDFPGRWFGGYLTPETGIWTKRPRI